MIAVMVTGVIVILAATLPAPGGARWIGLPLALLFAVLAWLFSSLTVTVSGDVLQWYFGPGVWKYRLPRADIAAVRIVRNSVLNGFGIRMRPGFRLYNVPGWTRSSYSSRAAKSAASARTTRRSSRRSVDRVNSFGRRSQRTAC
jgi:hypothetical protein